MHFFVAKPNAFENANSLFLEYVNFRFGDVLLPPLCAPAVRKQSVCAI